MISQKHNSAIHIGVSAVSFSAHPHHNLVWMISASHCVDRRISVSAQVSAVSMKAPSRCRRIRSLFRHSAGPRTCVSWTRVNGGCL